MQRPVNRESDTPMTPHQVWHREGDDFRQVGALKVPNLQAAAAVAMNRPPHTWMGLGDEDKVPDDQRRTKAGDVIVSPDGAAFRLKETTYGFTFEAVDFDALRQAAREIAAEWAELDKIWEELRGGVRDALAGGASFRQVMQEAGWHGMKGDEVAAIREEVEKEQGGIER
ncbi:hypothetical protein R5W24_000561 [Gemmata sp. JC717]|uniref:hypothetical protein n=1 Tax=Gemmata algarum TaxID=2975278 RepID=UPI0021BB90CB|nr:hypothetical protein [Gemmata algarum]MDY3551485.1 hypothetical protein [Gemmata algarum]